MNVPDDEILDLITPLLGGSKPGAAVHNLILTRASVTPLGLLTLDDLGMVAIAPVAVPGEPIPGDDFVRQCIAAAAYDHARGGPLYLVALAAEMSRILNPEDLGEVAENRARRLHADGRVQEHEQAVDATVLYAATVDGRRWYGEHWVTGPMAGKGAGPYPLRPGERNEADGWPLSAAVRRAVGLRW